MTIKFVQKTWIDRIINKLNRVVTHTPVVKTTTFDGEETITYSTAVSINAVVLRRKKNFTYDETGKLEQGPAYIIVDPTVATLNEDDKITFDGSTYIIKNNIIRYSDDDQDTAVYHYADLFLLS